MSGQNAHSAAILDASEPDGNEEQVLHSAIGTVTQVDGALYIVTAEGEEGYALFGPYRVLEPGSYEVEFFAMPQEMGNETCCVIDVCRRGKTVAADKDFTASELIYRNGLVSLRFEVIEKDTFEFRLSSTGSAALKVRYRRPLRLIAPEK